MTYTLYKYPRLYLNLPFEKSGEIDLGGDQAHYLRNVLRKNIGDYLRVFNGKDGEWVAEITDLGKKRGACVLRDCVVDQPMKGARRHLFFSPIKKQRMDFLIEKSVELGVTDLYPVLMNRSDSRKVNDDRVRAQIVEAAEQCERMEVPMLHDLLPLPVALSRYERLDLFVAMERDAGAMPLCDYSYCGDCGFIIGPEGGFDDAERALFACAQNVRTVALGEAVLRAETAVLCCLSYALLSRGGVYDEKNV